MAFIIKNRKKAANADETTLDERRNRLKKSQEMILNKKTSFVIQEAYRTARTNIIFSLADSEDRCKSVCVTSSNASEGKTTTTLNLAITFAQTGSKVLLIDADLRKPKIHQYLGVVKSDGLTTILSKQKSFEDVVYHNLRPGLDCLTSGSIPPNPAELLGSESMGELMKKLNKEYDYILIDTPPVTVVTDAVALSSYVSGILLIVREGYTNYESIDQALTLLKIAKAKLLGFFINDIDALSINYGSYRSGYGRKYKGRYGKYGSGSGGYGYDYGYGYGYGYGYSDDSSSRKKTEFDEYKNDSNESEVE